MRMVATALAMILVAAASARGGVAKLSGPESAGVNEPILISTVGTDGVPWVAFSANSPNPAATLEILYRKGVDGYVPYGVEFVAKGEGRYEIVAWPDDGDGDPSNDTPDVHVVQVGLSPGPGPNPGPAPGPDPEPPAPGPTPDPDITGNAAKVREIARSTMSDQERRLVAEKVFGTLINEINAGSLTTNKQTSDRFEQLFTWGVGLWPSLGKIAGVVHEVVEGSTSIPELRTRFFEIREGLEAIP